MGPKYVYETIMEFYKDKLPEFKKEAFEQQKQTDNVVVWVAGISTGAIALILSNSNNNTAIDLLYLKFAVGFFLLTIISAVIYRSYLYILQQKELSLMYILEGYCYGATCDTYGPIDITEHHTIKQIADSLKNDMGYDYDEWLDNQHLDRDFWVKLYNDWADFWKKQEKEGLENLAKVIAPLIGKLPKDVDEKIITRQDNTTEIQKIFTLRKICKWSYNGVMLFFTFAILSAAIGFFCTVT